MAKMDERLKEAFKEADTDGDGKLSYEEFKAHAMQRMKDRHGDRRGDRRGKGKKGDAADKVETDVK